MAVALLRNSKWNLPWNC